MTTCPCCAHSMIRPIRHHQVYCFCRNCWQEMSLLDQPSLGLESPALKPYLVPHQPRSLVSI